MPYKKYETVIGLEVHVQLSTQTKAFCADNAAYGAAPNTHISTISMAHPGTLPRVNEQTIKYAVRLGLALGCEITRDTRFDRKNYFYADLPKGFQTTQDSHPICVGGSLKIGDRNIRLHHIHIEEDAGKSIHDIDPKHSLIDLNRAGVPLLEVVTEPDLRSADEAAEFITKLRQVVRYLDICDGNMQEGSIRCDCNVSVRLKDETEYGTRCEIKNINSMRNAKRAIEYEARRQIKIIEKGGEIDQETRAFDAQTGHTDVVLRTKENAHDYRYFPEPDLLPVVLTEEYIDDIRSNMPSLPHQIHEELTEKYGLSDYDAHVLLEEKENIIFYKKITKYTKNYKAVANWLTNIIQAHLNDNQLTISEFNLQPKTIAELIQLVDNDKLSNAAAAQKVFPELVKHPDTSPLELAKKLNLIQDSDEGNIEAIIDSVIAKHPDKVKAYQKGKKGLLGMFMGEVMRASGGKVNPKVATRLLQEKLDIK